MTVAVIVFGLCMAGLVGWLVRQSLSIEPWLATDAGPELASHAVRSEQRLRLTLAVIVAVVTSLFGLFISAYLIRMEVADWRPLPEPTLLWINTAVLVLCSVSLQWAAWSARRSGSPALAPALLIGGVLSLVFVVGQYVVWQQLAALGYYLASNPASSFFYLLTGMHVLHLLGGMVAWARVTAGFFGRADQERVRIGVEMCAIYWHFLLAVWLVVFALFLYT